MKRVIIESPFAGDVPLNLAYARLCVRDCLSRNEAGIGSHLIYTQPLILDDTVPEERSLGMRAGFAWLPAAELQAFYTDLGISRGMQAGMTKAKEHSTPFEMRSLPREFFAALPKHIFNEWKAILMSGDRTTPSPSLSHLRHLIDGI